MKRENVLSSLAWGVAALVVGAAMEYYGCTHINLYIGRLAMWAASALYMGLALIAPRRAIWAVALGGVTAAVLLALRFGQTHGAELWLQVALWPVPAVLCVLLAVLTRHFCRGTPNLYVLRDVVAVITVCGLAGGTVVTLWTVVDSRITYPGVAMARLPVYFWRSWMCYLVLPLAVVAVREAIGHGARRRTIEYAVNLGAVVLMVAACAWVFRQDVADWRAVALPMLPFGILLGSALVIGPRTTAVVSAVMGMSIAGFTGENSGPFATILPRGDDHLIAGYVFVVLSATTTMLIATVMADRRRLGIEIASARQRLEQAILGSRIGIWDWTVATNHSRLEGGLPEILGEASHTEQPNFWSERLHPDDRERAFERLNAHLERDEPYDFEYRLRALDGSYRWFRSRGQAVRNAAGRAERMLGTITDVTDRHNAQEALRQSEERYRILVDGVRTIVWEVDVATLQFTFVSGAAEQILGYPLTDWYAENFWRNHIHPDDRQAAVEFCAEKTAQGLEHTFEYRMIAADGREVWIQDLASVVMRDGRPAGLRGVMIDITERKRAATALAASEERFRAIFERHAYPLWVYERPSGRFLAVNRAAVEKYGYTREQFLSMTLFDLRSQGHYASLESTLTAELPDVTPPCFWKHRTSDGRELDVMVTTCPVPWQPGRSTRLGTVIDVTEKLEAERLRDDQNRILGMIARDTPIEEILTEIVRTVEERDPSTMASIMLVNDDRCTASLGAGPSFSLDLISHLTNLPIGPGIGCCGAAMATGQRVIAADIRVHPFWKPFVSSAERFGIRACWSEPVFGTRGSVLGSFAVYRGHVHEPDASELRLVAEAANLAGIAIERRQMERTVREAETRFRAMFEQAAVGIVQVDLQGRFMLVNQRACRILGREPADLIGRSFREITHPDDIDGNLERFSQALESGVGYQLQKRYLRPDGSVVWADISVSSIRDGDRPKCFITAIHDVTDQRRATDALRSSEETNRALIAAIPDLIFRMDSDGRYLDYFGPADASLVLPPEQFIGRRAVDVLPADRAAQCMDAVDRVLATGQPSTYEYASRNNGAESVWEIRVTRIKEDEVLLLCRDVSLPRRAEAAIRAAEERYRSLVERLPLIVYTAPDGAEPTYVSPQFQEITGLSVDRFLGGRELFQKHIHADDRDRVTRFITAALRNGESGVVEYRLVRPDGQEAWLREQVAGVRCEVSGRPIIHGLIMDITAAKRAEAALRDNQRRLAQLVNQSPFAVIVWNTRFEITQWNPAAESIFGFTADEAIGRTSDIIVPPSSRSFVDNVWKQVITRRGGTHAVNENITRHGRHIICEWRNEPLAGPDGSVVGVSSFIQDVTERVNSERRQALMMRELDHRVKNNMAAVLSLAEQTGRTAETIAQFQTTFTGRVRALSRLHTILASTHWNGADLRETIRQAVEPYSGEDPERLSLDGPKILLPPRVAQSLTMAFNELATNAFKYGSLSQPAGRVGVSWSVQGSENQSGVLSVVWVERDGPPVAQPERRGFGMDLIDGAVTYQLRGSVEFAFPSHGFECRLVAPLHIDEASPQDAPLRQPMKLAENPL